MKKIVLLLVFISGLSACGSSSDEQDQWQDASGILRFIPAETSAVAVRLEPLPDAFRERFTRQNALMADLSQRSWPTSSDAADGDGDAEAEAVNGILRIAERLNQLSSPEGAAEAGFSPDAQAAVYLVGSQPVFRMELQSATDFEQFLEGLISETGIELELGELDGQSYRFLDVGATRFAIMFDADYVVATFAPTSTAESDLTIQFGLSLPNPNIADAGTLVELATRHGITGSQLAFLQPAGIFDAMTEAGGLIEQFATTMAPQSAQPFASLSEVCRTEIRRWPAAVKAITMGYSKADATGISGTAAIDLEPSMARDLLDLAQPVPGLGVNSDALMALGFSLNIEAVRRFAEKRIADVIAEPFECPSLAAMNSQAEAFSASLAKQPTPPFARDFRGFAFFVDDIPENVGNALDAIDGIQLSWILAMKNPDALLALGNLFVPQLAALELKPDGEPVELPQGLLNPTGQGIRIAMTDDRLGGALGPEREQRLDAVMDLPANDAAPVMAFAVDGSAYVDMFAGQVLAMNGANAALLDELQALYARQSMALKTTRTGLRFDFEVKLKEENK